MEVCRLPAVHFPVGFRRKHRTLQFAVMGSSQRLASNTQIKSQICETNSNRVFILGMGYVAQFLAHHLKAQGWSVSGTCTNTKKQKELEERGFDVHIFDACQPEWEVLDVMKCCTHLLISVPPVEGIGDPMLRHDEKLKSKLVDGNLQWLCYLSSTSIYGDSKGEWVDEDYPPKPSSKLGKMRLDAEEGWLKLGQDLGLSSYVFRLAGIYGPGRSAIDTILKKEPLSEGQKRRATRTFTSRVHVADICQALKASMSIQSQRRIYNIVDDDPASRAEVFAFAMQLMERKWPGLIDPTLFSVDGTQTQLSGGQKRVSNARLKKELGVRLLHPSYRSGLQGIIENMKDPV